MKTFKEYVLESKGLRFGVERMPEKLVKDLKDLSNNVLGYDFHDKGIVLSFNKKIDTRKLAQYLKTQEYMIDYEGQEGREYIYNIKE